MVKLTEIEKKIYNNKRKLIYKRMPLNRKLSPTIHLIVDTGLISLIKNNSYEFISDMYIDYLERMVRLEDFREDNTNLYKVYYYGFHFKDKEALFLNKNGRYNAFFKAFLELFLKKN